MFFYVFFCFFWKDVSKMGCKMGQWGHQKLPSHVMQIHLDPARSADIGLRGFHLEEMV